MAERGNERREQRDGLWLCAGVLWLAGCAGGTDTGNPLTDLDIGSCKSDSDPEGEFEVHRHALTRSDGRYDGLTCLRAQRDGDVATLAVYNFSSGCHRTFDAEPRDQDGKLAVVLTNPGCLVAGCGSCLYDADFSFELSAPGAAAIALIDQPCSGDEKKLGSWQVPEREGEVTLRCSYAPGLSWHAGRLGLFGAENMPCRMAQTCTTPECNPNPVPCDDGLSCSEIAEGDSRCLKQCTSDNDCAVPEAMRCTEGLCAVP